MNIRFYHDPNPDHPHIENHAVHEHEVEEVLLKPGEDRPGFDSARVAIGQTRSGRYLKVIYVPDSQIDSVFVITAYDLNGKPLKAFKRRIQRRSRL